MTFQRLARGLLTRWLTMKGEVVLPGRSNRRALISFVIPPPPPWDTIRYFQGAHNNRFQCHLMAGVLQKRGYTVHIRDCFDPRPPRNISYDLFFGHNRTFSSLARRMPAKCRKVLLTAGASPAFFRERLEIRRRNLAERKPSLPAAFRAPPPEEGDYAAENFRSADAVLMLGNEWAQKTWSPPSTVPLVRRCVNPCPFPPRRHEGTGGGFLFLSSVNQLRRGLDLLLDVFSRRKETLYIGSSYEREKDFAELYARELRQSPNIVPLGWVDLSGPRYRDVLKRCRFCILPSCAEAYPGSILNPMTEGLIPVMTLESGFDDADRYGILIREGTVEGVSAAVDRAVSMSEEEIAVKRDRLLEAARAFQPEAFRAGFERFMDEVEGT